MSISLSARLTPSLETTILQAVFRSYLYPEVGYMRRLTSLLLVEGVVGLCAVSASAATIHVPAEQLWE